jgi:pyrimidine-nucleoside phosphorylase
MKGDPIDHSVGIVVHHKVGDRVETGQPLFTIHAHDPQTQAEARARLLEAHTWSDSPVESLPLFYGVVRST